MTALKTLFLEHHQSKNYVMCPRLSCIFVRLLTKAEGAGVSAIVGLQLGLCANCATKKVKRMDRSHVLHAGVAVVSAWMSDSTFNYNQGQLPYRSDITSVLQHSGTPRALNNKVVEKHSGMIFII